MNLSPLMNIALKAVKSASKIMLRLFDRPDTVIIEKDNNEENCLDSIISTEEMLEQEIIRVIHESYPTHAVLKKRGELIGTHDYTWILDPINGTDNFIRKHPHFCISLGIRYRDRMEHGLIYDPLRQELFAATFGVGAFLNDRRIRVSERKQLIESIMASELGKDSGNLVMALKMLASVTPQVAGIRGSGAGALDCAYVACGRIDGIFGIGYSPWNTAAGILMIREAGGLVTDFDGETKYFDSNNLIAANPRIAKALLRIIKEKIGKN